jgi:triacylglycerol lipase
VTRHPPSIRGARAILAAVILAAVILAAVILAAVMLGGCADFAVDQQERCAELDERLRDCFGEDVETFECDAITESDRRALVRALHPDRCELARELVPFDGDYRSVRCRMDGEGCRDALEPLGPAASARPTLHPIVLVNGIDSSPLFRYSERIVETLELDGGNVVALATLPPYESTSLRSRVLWQRIEEVRRETSAARVNLICHSLGGLDCRYVVSPGGLAWELGLDPAETAGAVASVTTFSTAHRGTPVADVALGYLPSGQDGDDADALAAFVGDWLGEASRAGDGDLRSSLAALTEAQTAAFNASVLDAEGVYYQSWAGFSVPYGEAPAGYEARLAELCAVDQEGSDGLALFEGAHDFMAAPLIDASRIVDRARERALGPEASPHEVLDPNDGLCPIRAARWGRFRGCVPADHMEQLGQRLLPDVNVRTGIDIARFYLHVATDLAELGL